MTAGLRDRLPAGTAAVRLPPRRDGQCIATGLHAPCPAICSAERAGCPFLPHVCPTALSRLWTRFAPRRSVRTAQHQLRASETSKADHGGQSVSSSELILRSKLVECRDKFLQIARDKDINDADRRATAKVALDAWRAELPDHRSFVEACLEALGRIVKSGNPETEKSERDYLDGLIARAA